MTSGAAAEATSTMSFMARTKTVPSVDDSGPWSIPILIETVRSMSLSILTNGALHLHQQGDMRNERQC